MPKPEIFKTKGEVPADMEIVEAVESSWEELFVIRNPKMKKGPMGAPIPSGFEEAKKAFLETVGNALGTVYVYYPWLGKAFHIPEESVYFELRTARNKHIINKEEQEAYRNTFIGIAGMSVGSNVAMTLARTGGPRRMRLADFDTIEISNLNRIPAPLASYGKDKANFFAEQIYEIDPWAELELYDKGVTKDNLEEFIRGLDIFIDEMDSLDLKIRARFIAKKLRVPVLMATDNGNDVTFDVERYDLDPETPIFNGRISLTEETIGELKTPQDWMRIAAQIAGPETHSPRMLESIAGLGKTLAGVPQLGSTAALSGAAASYAVRQIAAKAPLPSGRYLISLDEKFIPNYHSATETQKREQALKNFFESLGKQP